ncbi:hypothetical protein [Achromobacter xylosoxidans]|uniref:hypothetical protein n=1 Tax=Alcaligenes xylosoxydans xylosoxydans TaxID=85698 RepID=UPI0006BEBE14|nr:hypothetical protein [Achromobacter xylosoxidans]MCH4575719.1 hypothetical protein [Achromobacter xylosoxidans]NEV03882.1 hypothetical protein [Achromobacter xylosoxidans]PNL98350.1 hypothetical protein A6J83_024890 [Achromobacter xylosoxidans]CUK22000.1 Uncharacterised protein [Achromobacter xylosoxidans]
MNSPIKLPPMPNELWATLDADQEDRVYAYAEQAARKARSAAIEDVACMICRRFDLKIPADLGPKLVHAIRSMDQESNHE